MKKSRKQRKKLKEKAARRFQQELSPEFLKSIFEAVERAKQRGLPPDATVAYDGEIIIRNGIVVNLEKLNEMLEEVDKDLK